MDWKKATLYNKNETDSYTDYMMVQPAFVVADSRGAVVQWWSWTLMGLKSPSALSIVPNPDPSHDLKEVRLVAVRPVTADIGPSVTEGRPVRLQAMLPPGWMESPTWNTVLPEPQLTPGDET